MSEIIDNFWKQNGTIQKISDVASSASGISQPAQDGMSRLGQIANLIKAIMAMFG